MARKPRVPQPLPTASVSIHKLRAQGMSDAAIGRAVGRDSSLIGQIARGKKPGSESMQGALDDLVRGKKPRAVERRTARLMKDGKPTGKMRQARFRESNKKVVGPSAKEMLRTAKLLDARGQNMALNVTWGQLENVISNNVTYSSGDLTLYADKAKDGTATGANAGQFARKLEAFMKRYPNLSDREQAEKFMSQEFQRRYWKGSSRFRYNAKSTRFADLKAVSFQKREAHRPYRRRKSSSSKKGKSS